MEKLLLLSWTLAMLVCLGACGGKSSTGNPLESIGCHYRLQVRIDPASQKLEAEAWIQEPPSSLFYLHKNFAIDQVWADGVEVPFHRDTAADPLPVVSVSSAVAVEAREVRELHVKYEGQIKGTIATVNKITSELIELALYAGWYPVFNSADPYDFSLMVDLPQDFVTVTNGLLKEQQLDQGRNRTTWDSFQPGFDIVLLASPHFQKMEATRMGTTIEIYYNETPKEELQTKTDDLLKGMSRLSDSYGAAQLTGLLRIVNSPRDGSGYSRIPLLVLPEAYIVHTLLKQEFGQARDFHGTAHEMAHFWWNIADTGTPDDWINEGLAEFSAFRLSEEYFGNAFADLLISEYRQHAAQSTTQTSILETEGSSEDRYVNRYEKTTLILIEARRRFGQEPLDGLLKALHTRYAGTRQATTALFLGEAEHQLGADAKAFFSAALSQKQWSDPQALP